MMHELQVLDAFNILLKQSVNNPLTTGVHTWSEKGEGHWKK